MTNKLPNDTIKKNIKEVVIMDIKIKCTNCGCKDLEEVDFPYEAKLIQTAIGIAGESSAYDLEEEFYTTTYICTECGHFEFFNPELAKLILEERKKNAKIENEITEIDNQILTNEKELQHIICVTYPNNVGYVNRLF